MVDFPLASHDGARISGYARAAPLLAGSSLASLTRVLLAPPSPDAVGGGVSLIEWAAVLSSLLLPLSAGTLARACCRDIDLSSALAWARGEEPPDSGSAKVAAAAAAGGLAQRAVAAATPQLRTSTRAAFVNALRLAIDREIEGESSASTRRGAALEAAENFVAVCATLCKTVSKAFESCADLVDCAPLISAYALILSTLFVQHTAIVSVCAPSGGVAPEGALLLSRDALEDSLRKLVLITTRSAAESPRSGLYAQATERLWAAVSHFATPVFASELRALGGVADAAATAAIVNDAARGDAPAAVVEHAPAAADVAQRVAPVADAPPTAAPAPEARRGFFRSIISAIIGPVEEDPESTGPPPPSDGDDDR